MKDFLVPVKRCKTFAERYRFPRRALLCSARDADRLPLEELAGLLKARAGIGARLAWNAEGDAAVRLVRDPAVARPEGYRLDVTPTGIRIAGMTDAGVYYGVQTLRELIEQHGAELPCCRIVDWPDFARRGVYYDCARGKVPTLDTLCELVTRLSRWKINEFQIYIKNAFTWLRHPAISRGFDPYTPEDILRLQAHCRERHVRFVPSLATLSHSELTLQVPAYRPLAELPGARGWEGGTMLCPTDPRSPRLVRELYAEYVPLFEAEDLNVCCDEPWELGKGRSRRAVARRGAGRVYLDFLLKVHRICAQHGKRMNVWGDIVLKYPELISELPPDVVMLNWDYGARGKCMARTSEFTEAGVPVVVCPGTSAWQRHGSDLPNALGNVSNFARVGRRLQAAGLLNTDWGDYGHRNLLAVSLHGFAHGAAHAWHGAGVDDATFTERFVARVFEEGHDLATAIRILGDVGSLGENRTRLYHALVEPMKPPVSRFFSRFRRTSIVAHYPDYQPSAIDAADPARVQACLDTVDAEAFARVDGRRLAAFERLALTEYGLAARMDRLAAQRILLGRALRAGTPSPARDARQWADAMRRLRSDFENAWLARNRPARLADNLKLMTWAEEECRGLVGRQA